MKIVGEVTKIIEKRDPIIFKVKTEEHTFTVKYHGFLPVKEKDIIHASCMKDDNIYVPKIKPLVIIPEDEQKFKDNVHKSLFFERNNKIQFWEISKFYDEVLENIDVTNNRNFKEKEKEKNKNEKNEDKELVLYNEEEARKNEEKEEENITYIDPFTYMANCIVNNIRPVFTTITNTQRDLIFKWWEKNHIFRQFHLLGLNNSEIRKSKDILNLLRKLEENPFKLTFITLEKAVEISKIFGKMPTEEQVICGKILRYLDKLMEFGSLCCDLDKVSETYIDFNKYKDVLLEDYGMVIENDLIYTSESLEIENFVADEINKRLLKNKINERKISKLNINSESIYRIFPEANFVLTDEQESALFKSLNSHISIISGGAGCGKTTLIKQILKNLEENNEKYILTSLTGKAVLRMKEVLNLDDDRAQTMHRLIYNSSKIGKFYFLIIDEVSMISTELFYDFLKKFSDYYKIIFIGDKNQLPPIGKGRFYRDIIKSGKIPHSKLTINKRFSDSTILENSNGLVNEDRNIKVPFEFKEDSNFHIVDPKLYEKLISSLHKKGIKDSQIAVLSPYNSNLIELNKTFRDVYLKEKKTYRYKEKTFINGDRVKQLRNVYLESSFDIMNGEEGYITRINNDSVYS